MTKAEEYIEKRSFETGSQLVITVNNAENALKIARLEQEIEDTMSHQTGYKGKLAQEIEKRMKY